MKYKLYQIENDKGKHAVVYFTQNIGSNMYQKDQEICPISMRRIVSINITNGL